MLDSLLSRSALALLALCCAGLTACGSFSGKKSVADIVSPYKIDMVQGNVVTREQFEYIKVGMPRNQVREVLVTPLLSSVFHEQRWDYVFSLRRQGAELQSRRISLFFNGDVLERIEADPLPSEAEFVSTLKSLDKGSKLPALDASEESLKKFPPVAQPAAPVPVTVAPGDYPPLEPRRP